jgi:HK97 family phage prohead protease
VIALAERGDLGGMSFGFRAIDEAWNGDTRELREVELHEISIVQSWPAYTQTEISLRSRPNGCAPGLARLWLETTA